MTAVIWPDINSGGLFMLAIPARMKPQLLTGPQKCVVLGPTGLFKNALSAVAMADDLAPSTAACLPSAGAGGVDSWRRPTAEERASELVGGGWGQRNKKMI